MLEGLKALMKKHKMSQRELIERAYPEKKGKGQNPGGYWGHQAQLSKWFNNKRAPMLNNQSLKRYAKVFSEIEGRDISLKDLL